jgi:hypothetical protein
VIALATRPKEEGKFELKLRVHPQIKWIWHGLPDYKKKIILRSFQMMVLSAADSEIDEESKRILSQITLELRFDPKSVELLKEIFELTEKSKMDYEKLRKVAKKALGLLLTMRNIVQQYDKFLSCESFLELNSKEFRALLEEARELGLLE